MPPESVPLALNAWLRWDTVRRVLPSSRKLGDVVEVGCGQGGFGVRLAALSDSYRAYEPDRDSFEIAGRRLADVAAASIENRMLPSTDEPSADLVCAFEVLEHIDDDIGALAAWSRWVRPGGLLIISVPAHQHRFGPWDTAVGHFRRYGRSDLTRLLENAGFEVEGISAYGFPLGYALEWVRDRLAPPGDQESCAERTGKSGRLLQPKSWMRWVTQLGTLPFRLLQRPFASSDLGTGWVAVARRSS